MTHSKNETGACAATQAAHEALKMQGAENAAAANASADEAQAGCLAAGERSEEAAGETAPEAGPAPDAVPDADAAPDAEPALSFEQKCEKADKLLQQNPNYRRYMYELLKVCADGADHDLATLEDFVAAQPGYARLKQPPFFPIQWLTQAYALEERYRDAQGTVHSFEELAELSEDEFDDLVETATYALTDVGEHVIDEFNPARWIAAVLDEVPERYGIYLQLLDFLREPRSFAAVDKLLRGNADFQAQTHGNELMTPGMFIDKLSSVGGIYFNAGWKLTEEGEELLQLLKSNQEQ